MLFFQKGESGARFEIHGVPDEILIKHGFTDTGFGDTDSLFKEVFHNLKKTGTDYGKYGANNTLHIWTMYKYGVSTIHKVITAKYGSRGYSQVADEVDYPMDEINIALEGGVERLYAPMFSTKSVFDLIWNMPVFNRLFLEVRIGYPCRRWVKLEGETKAKMRECFIQHIQNTEQYFICINKEIKV